MTNDNRMVSADISSSISNLFLAAIPLARLADESFMEKAEAAGIDKTQEAVKRFLENDVDIDQHYLDLVKSHPEEAARLVETCVIMISNQVAVRYNADLIPQEE